jgi:alpha-glucosidase
MSAKQNKIGFFFLLPVLIITVAFAQQIKVVSPNQKIRLSLVGNNGKAGSWALAVEYINNGVTTPVFQSIKLGLLRRGQAFSDNLTLLEASKPEQITEQYTALHGKRSQCSNEAMETTVQFANSAGKKMNLVLRAYNNGIAFRYIFPEKEEGKYKMENELTAYQVPATLERWLQHFVTSYEGLYPNQKDTFKTGEWGYPALFKTTGGACWALVSEAGIDRNYCAAKLINNSIYKLAYPSATDGNSIGNVNPEITLPWASPWRVAIIGQLADIVESTLIEDVAAQTKLDTTGWIKPGVSSWVYWANNHGTKDFRKVCEYVDLAARMGWPYTLFDWEWDKMGNGGNLEDAVKYANGRGVKPLLWYNSGGKHNRITADPRDRLTTHEAREKEFAWLNSIGIYGVKVDFFESDKQDMMNYYLDILEDAAKYKLMVDFHGSTVPRGWSRTYPNLMSMEAVYGGEQYNNAPVMTSMAAVHNTTLPFTRNVVGPMDYTPVAFTNSQHPHTTTYAHELALSVVFESGIQHFADRPEGFDSLPDAPKEFLRHVPVAWDDTKFIDGYPGNHITLARRKANIWYVAGINGNLTTDLIKLNFKFLPPNKKFRLTLIADGENRTLFQTQHLVVGYDSTINLKWLPRGGFAGILSEW